VARNSSSWPLADVRQSAEQRNPKGERVGKAKPFHVMTKPTGPICNLDCTYCFYLEKESLYSDSTRWAMNDEVLESFIRQYIEAQPSEVVDFAWQGGEPTLLGVEYFERVVELQDKHAQGKQIHNAFQTNGTLIDEAWASFFARNKFLVGVSIDGPRELHDTYRVDKGNAPTFDRVMRGIHLLRDHGAEFNTLTVVHRKNSVYPLEIYEFLKEIGSGYMQFIPIVERKTEQPRADGLVLIDPGFAGPAKVTEWSVEPLAYGRFLSRIFDAWIRSDVGRVFVQHFEVALQNWLGVQASLCIFRPTCGSAMALEHNGDMYSCDHFVYPEYRLGNLMNQSLGEMAQSEEQKRFGQQKKDSLPSMCRSCSVRFACHGECPKHRFAITPDGEPGLNYLCEGYKHFFQHVNPFMRYMAEELRAGRGPASVMEILGGAASGVSRSV
jgi:uncharacterized protein